VLEKKVELTQIEEIKMLSGRSNDPLFNLEKCTLSEMSTILQTFSNDPSLNIHQTWFGSYIYNHVLK
jgi:hypothetical protein